MIYSSGPIDNLRPSTSSRRIFATTSSEDSFPSVVLMCATSAVRVAGRLGYLGSLRRAMTRARRFASDRDGPREGGSGDGRLAADGSRGAGAGGREEGGGAGREEARN